VPLLTHQSTLYITLWTNVRVDMYDVNWWVRWRHTFSHGHLELMT